MRLGCCLAQSVEHVYPMYSSYSPHCSSPSFNSAGGSLRHVFPPFPHFLSLSSCSINKRSWKAKKNLDGELITFNLRNICTNTLNFTIKWEKSIALLCCMPLMSEVFTQIFSHWDVNKWGGDEGKLLFALTDVPWSLFFWRRLPGIHSKDFTLWQLWRRTQFQNIAAQWTPVLPQWRGILWSMHAHIFYKRKSYYFLSLKHANIVSAYKC